MIQIYFADEKDFINQFKNFADRDIKNILKYVELGLHAKNSKIIKIRKWENK